MVLIVRTSIISNQSDESQVTRILKMAYDIPNANLILFGDIETFIIQAMFVVVRLNIFQ